VKNETDAAAVWKKIISIHADRGSMFETNLITQLQNSRYTEGDSMREHLAKMVKIKERLAEMSYALTDKSFVSYICTSISLAPNFRSLITTLNASAHEKLTSRNLIWHLNEEANSLVLEDTINKSNKAMLAATSKARGGKGKEKVKQTSSKCSNCDKPDHTADKCWRKGGGMEGKAPEWWLEKQKNAKKNKSKKDESANNTEKAGQSDDESDNYAMHSYTLPKNSSALICTSDFKHEAHSITKSDGTILDCSASSHFTPERSKLLNYRKISPESIRSADGHHCGLHIR
jgi:hypothetical protein